MKTLNKALILTLFSVVQSIAQQPFTLDKKIKPTELKWVDYKDTKNPNLSGKVCFTKVTQNRDTAYYFVRGCSMYQPVFFAVASLNKSQKLKISLAKDNWKQPQKTGTTDAKGQWSSMFKTEGGFGIMVVKQNPSVKYNIRVWLGKEFEDLGMPNPFQKNDIMKKILVLIVLALSLNVKAQIGDRIVQTAEDIVEVNGEAEEVIGAFQDAGSQFEDVRNRFNEAYELYDDLENLDLTECSPDFSNNVSNSMVATCASNTECKECYKTAMKSMNFYRKQLGRLNCIYNNTVNFSNRAISFGDTYSGFHAMSGVAWQKQKTDILKSLDKLKITYDTKYTEFIKGLATSLRSFDTCEQQFGGNGNWYQKVGFIYFEFMKDKYKRNN